MRIAVRRCVGNSIVLAVRSRYISFPSSRIPVNSWTLRPLDFPLLLAVLSTMVVTEKHDTLVTE